MNPSYTRGPIAAYCHAPKRKLNHSQRLICVRIHII